jgi:hypothetical protein
MSQIVKSDTSPALSNTRKTEIRDYIKAGVAEQKTFPRLVFGMDATASRQPTWDLAARLQADMFTEAAAVGGLSMQLVYYRGIDECRASKWFTSGAALTQTMIKITCLSGGTQISRILKHTLNQARTSVSPIRALVFVGDCFEEDLDQITPIAADLGRARVPAFMFQEGHNKVAEQAFRRIAEVSGGVWASFDLGSASSLSRLLRGAAKYASGHAEALSEIREIAGLLGR